MWFKKKEKLNNTLFNCGERFNYWLNKKLPEIKQDAESWNYSDRKLYIFAKYCRFDDEMDIIHMLIPKNPKGGIYIGYYINREFKQSKQRGTIGLITDSMKDEIKYLKNKRYCKLEIEYPF